MHSAASLLASSNGTSFRSTEGDNPACYMPLLDTNFLSFPAGHLCVDEVTIKSDLVWNVKNNEITGFCNIGTSSKTLKDQLRRILANEEDDDTDYQPVMANQWRFPNFSSTMDHLTLTR